MATAAGPDADLPTVLWRPGCGFCNVLFVGLERHQIAHARVNIWDDDDARALLSSRIGCETVPSVLVGDDLLVNPSVTELIEHLGA